MALDPDQCAQMIDVCEREKVLLGVAYYRRFYPVVARIRQLIDAGQLGRVLSVACVTGNSSRFPADDWRVVRSQGGGGPLMDIASHRLDLFMHLLGEVDSVKTNLIESTDYEAEQVAMMLLEFKAGCVGVLQCYFGAADTPDRLEIIGTEGRITMEHLNAGEFMLFNSNGCTLERHPPASNLHAPLIADFSAAIIEGRSPAVDGRIGKQTNDVIQMAYDAAGRIT